MSKVKSLDELKKIRERVAGSTDIRVTGESADRIVIAVGMATCGIAAGARPVMTALLEEIAAQKIENVSVVATGCLGFCYAEPMVEIRMPNVAPIRYQMVDEKLAKEIIDKHIAKGELINNAIFSKEVPR